MSVKAVSLERLIREAGEPLAGTQLRAGWGAVEVAGVSSDTRTLRPGQVFVVIPGTQEHGVRYAGLAARTGAAALVAPPDCAGEVGIHGLPVIVAEDPRGALAALASAFHGHPSRDLVVVGVSGTNGKTTTIHLLSGVLDGAGLGPSALIGTIERRWGDTVIPAGTTTPGAAELHELLGRARDDGCRAAALEVSSHALDQRRVEGVEFAAAVFTNLTGDHQDYHGSMDAYADAKARLFRQLGPDAVAAVNAEDPYTPTMVRECAARVVRYGLDEPNEPDVTARDVTVTSDGVEFTLVGPTGEARVTSPLIGRYNVMNLLAAAAVGVGLGVPAARIAAGLTQVAGVPGRLEAVDEGQDFDVLVDYAHTDDAVSNVLRNVRSVAQGRVLAVLGCGGDRDRTKRPRMARAAAELADLCWFTSDNPRSESPRGIIDDMLGGVWGARNVRVQEDRRAAISEAIGAARPRDVVVLLGKGHEAVQVLHGSTVPFDDRHVAVDVLNRLAGPDLGASGGPGRTR